MINIDNYLGKVELSYNYLTELIRYTASSCFGVADFKSDDKIHSFLRILTNNAFNDNGVSITVKNGKLHIGIHITVLYGTNLEAISKSIAHKIKYAVEDKTGMKTGKITVFIDDITE